MTLCFELRSAWADIVVTNIESGTTLRYPVTFLQGNLTAQETELSASTSSATGSQTRYPAAVAGSAFKVFVELAPGKNSIVLDSGKSQAHLELNYQPATSLKKLHVVYITPSDGDTHYLTQKRNDPQDYQAKLDTSLKLLQTFTAERMNSMGFGRKTFNLDLDEHGKVIIRTLHYPSTAAELQAKTGNELYGLFFDWLRKPLPGGRKNVAFMSFVGYDPVAKKPLGHTALGGSELALFSVNGMFSWPSRLEDVNQAFQDQTRVDDHLLWDDSAGRGTLWALASTTLGATMHEMGHAFGLPHSTDPESIMLRGFDHINRFFALTETPLNRPATGEIYTGSQYAIWDRFSAAILNDSPYFQPDPAAGTCITTWQLAARPVVWERMPAAPNLSAEQVKALIYDLSHRPTTDQKGAGEEVFRSVDFNLQYGDQQNVVSYALCRFKVEQTRTLTLMADDDDGVRVWVNGSLF